MLTYTFECLDCGGQFEFEMPITDCDTPPACGKCGGKTKKIVVLNETGFILSGDGWASKDARAKKQMTERNRAAGRRMARHSRPAPGLVPNYKGAETETWREAQGKAATEGKDTSSYEPLVQQEKGVAI